MFIDCAADLFLLHFFKKNFILSIFFIICIAASNICYVFVLVILIFNVFMSLQDSFLFAFHISQ